MSFDSFSDFLAMGGHGAFVWSAYAIALIVITGNLVWPRWLVQRNIARVRRQVALSAQQENTTTNTPTPETGQNT